MRVFQGTLTCSGGTTTVTAGSQGSSDALAMLHAPVERMAALLEARSWHCLSSACSPSSQGGGDMLPSDVFVSLTYFTYISRYMPFIQLYM